LGQVGTGTLSHDLKRWWYQVRGKSDPFLKLGEENKRDKTGGDYVWALKEIDFDVKEGEVLGIIGRNGAGKSTLLKLLSRVTAPTTGVIKAKGRIASLLEVGTGFHPELTGRENIYLNGAILGMRKQEITRKLDAIIEFSGVERYVDTPVKRYSSGMYVRLAFAVAAYLDSEILIVDEVLAVGDAEFQRKCLGKMGEVSRGQGRTILFVSHNMGAIKNLCTRILVLNQGKMHFQGAVNAGIREYLSSTVTENERLALNEIFNNENLDPLITWINVRALQNNVPTVEIHNNEECRIEVDYRLRKEVVGFRIWLTVYDDRNIVIFKSFFDEDKLWGSNFSQGQYKSSVIIPADIFIEGRYVMEIHGTVHGERILNPKDGINFDIDVYETGKVYRKHWDESFRGLITLPLTWSTVQTGN
jgi:lipopolysaccharide transport system ATP-binding protein